MKIRRQREEIYRHFGEVNAQSDAVPFETGPKRVAEMAARDRIRRWQTYLRSFYLLEVAAWSDSVSSARPTRGRSPSAVFENDFRFDVRASSARWQIALRSSQPPTHTTQTQ